MLSYGLAGTRKSLIVGGVTEQIVDLCESQGEPFGIVDINCQPIDTLDQAVYELVQTVAVDHLVAGPDDSSTDESESVRSSERVRFVVGVRSVECRSFGGRLLGR